MKKIFLLLLSLFLLSGCSRVNIDHQDSGLRMVVQIDVSCSQDGESIHRSYTSENKMEAMLLYLRLLKSQGPAHTNPEELLGPACKIVVQFSNGQKRIYRLRADRFLSTDSQPWQSVDQAHAQELYKLVMLMSSDTLYDKPQES